MMVITLDDVPLLLLVPLMFFNACKWSSILYVGLSRYDAFKIISKPFVNVQ